MARGSVAAAERAFAQTPAAEPPEARGLERDEVHLLVSRPCAPATHLLFRAIASVLERGDLLVVNTSATMKASIQARRTFGMRVDVHLSTQLPGGLWVIEVRQSDIGGSKPLRLGMAGEVLRLPEGGRVSILAPYPFGGDLFARARLWTAALELPAPLDEYLEKFGAPIRYAYVTRAWPIEHYQTIFARETGSAEMPSAGRPFTHRVLDALRDKGVAVAAIVLHTGVASLEDHEPPYEERYRVPTDTAALVNRTHESGGRVIAVGTTVVRALETVTDENGVTHPGSGWTDVVVGADRPVRSVDGLLTGFHEAAATHLALVREVARRMHPNGETLLQQSYREALERGYLLHEFGDVHLLLPS